MTSNDEVDVQGASIEPGDPPALALRIGNKPGASLRIKFDGFEVTRKEGRIVEGVVQEFKRGAIIFSGKMMQRMFVLEPSEDVVSYEFEGFFVRGRFRIVEKINDGAKASERWREFQAE